ncbi:MAG: glycosyltransferase family 4 protein [Nitrospirota bacterium]
MRIALIRKTYTPFGGAERHVAQFTSALRARGDEVHLYAAKWDDSASASGGITVHRVPVVSATRWAEVWSFALRASAMAASGEYDIVHSFDRVHSCDVYRAGDGVHREWLRRRRAAQPAWQRAIPSFNPTHLVYLTLERGLFEGRCRAIIANSERGKAEILTHYRAEPSRIRVIYNGVDLDRFRPPDQETRRKARALAGCGENDRIILFVGSGFARKGLETAVRTLARLAPGEAGQTALVAVGRGDTRRYARIAASLGVGDRVRFVGPVTDVTPWYHAADVLLLPTLYDPFANVCLEALACGLPVVTTAANGASEALTTDTGVVIEDAQDVEAVASGVETVLRWGRTRVDACRVQAEQFPQERYVRETLALYDELRR